MKKLIETLKAQKYAIIWTASYVFITWAILMFLFNFNIFSAENWHRLLHARLVGFAGATFFIMILAALPLYVATTAIIVRTKKPLITLPKILPEKPKAEEKKEESEEKKEPESKPEDNLPENLPNELKQAFIKARIRQQAFPIPQPVLVATPNIQQKTESVPNEPAINTDTDFPIPEDFDFESEDFSDDNLHTFDDDAAPIFQSINFDEPKETTQTNDIEEITKVLNTKNIKTTLKDEIIIGSDFALAAHCDSDFWIADPELWFAAGKQKNSPTVKLLEVATSENLTPILYLGSTNISDLDSKVKEWEHQGIKVITDLNEIK